MSNTKTRRSAFQWVNELRVPIWVYEVVDDDIFPVKFEYKARGYKGLRFTERKSKITYE